VYNVKVDTTKNNAEMSHIDHLRFRNSPAAAIILAIPVIATCGGKPLNGSIMSKMMPATP